MSEPALQRYARRRPLGQFVALGVIALLVYVSLFASNPANLDPTTFDHEIWDFSSFTDSERFAAATRRLSSFVAGFAAPDLTQGYLGRALELTWQTLSAAVLGVAIAIVMAYLLALGASRAVCVGEERGPRWLRWFPLRSTRAALCSGCRLVLDVLRAVPDFAWAVLLVPLLGIGPMTGMVALAISVTGILGKIYSELWDSVDPRRYENVRAVGAGRLRTFLYGIRPHASRSMLSYTLMRAECAIRNAAVIGAVGGGGLGAEIKLRLDYGEYDRVATMVLFTLALTAAADMGANFIRRQLRNDPNHPRSRGGRPLSVQLARKWAGIGFALFLVAWSVWYQGREHSSAIVPEAQLPKLLALFQPGGWKHLAIFEDLLKPELAWEAEREGALVRSHFVARKSDWPATATDPAAFAAALQGKRLVLGPRDREPAHDGPRSYLEGLAGKPLEQIFAEVRTTDSDVETLLLVAKGEADIGAIEWESFGPARKDPRTAEYLRRKAPVVDIAHTTDWYRAVKREPGALPVSLRSALIPVAMAVIGTLLGVLAAMALCYPHSVAFQLEPQRFTGEAPGALRRSLRAAQLLLARTVALVSRAIPEVMWAMFFVAFFGAGVVAGTFALAIHTLGVLVRVFSETVDNIPYKRFEQATGGSRMACFGYAAVPASWRDWLTYSFFQFESNVRAGVVLGIIGSAGLGFVFSVNFEHFQYPKAATNLLVIILLTVVIDRVSRLLKLTRVAT